MTEAFITRREMEKALVETAWAYYLKGNKVQYDSQELNTIGGTEGNKMIPLRKHWGGAWRASKGYAPEEATSDSALFTVCSDFAWKVYRSALNYPLLGHALNALTRGYWSYTEQPKDMVVIRWAENEDSPCAEICEYPGSTVTEKHRVDLKTVRAFLADWEKNLRPADILITYDHTMMYIGGGYVLDSWGNKYSMVTGRDAYERKGSVYTLHRLEDIYLTGEDPVTGSRYRLGDSPEVKFFAVIRPLDVLTKAAGTGNLGDDVLNAEYILPKTGLLRPDDIPLSGYTITPATRSRLQYPGLGIDRTVNITPYGTAEKGGTLTYSVKLSNQSDDPAYCTYWTDIHKTPYYGQDHTGIMVTEKIPTGTVLERVGGNAVIQGDTIIWMVDIPAGGTLDLKYTVRVTAELGDVIISEGGYVANIPSNRIENRVGGKKLAKPSLAGLRNLSGTGVEKWPEKYGINAENGKWGLVNDIYAKAAGLSVELPPAQELLNALFVCTHVEKTAGYFTNFNTPWSAWMYALRTDVEAKYRLLRDMLVRGYLGGVYVYTEGEESRINEFSVRYMEPGDIVVGMKLSLDFNNGAYRTVESSRVIVYLGDDRFASIGFDGGIELHNTDEILWPSFIDDVFLCLRPSQAYPDINALYKRPVHFAAGGVCDGG